MTKNIDEAYQYFRKSGTINIPYYELHCSTKYWGEIVTDRCDWCCEYFNDYRWVQIYIPMLDVYICEDCLNSYINWDKLYKTRDIHFEKYNSKCLEDWLLDRHHIYMSGGIGYKLKSNRHKKKPKKNYRDLDIWKE